MVNASKDQGIYDMVKDGKATLSKIKRPGVDNTIKMGNGQNQVQG